MDAENHSDGFEMNLFGERVYQVKRKKGRPPFERTEKNANKVSMLLAMGWKNDDIAAAILDPRTGKPISVPTLKRHFRPELQVRLTARLQMMAREFMRTWEKAEEGNVGAMRLFKQLREDNDQMIAAARFAGALPGDRVEPEEKVEPVGKKEQARRDAEDGVGSNPLFTPGVYRL